MTAADLIYDPDTHTSRTSDGQDVPHVTHVLAAVGVSTDFEAMGTLSRKLAENIAFANSRGTAVHADCHAYDDGDLDIADCDPAVRPYIEAWAVARVNLGLVPLERERRLYHPHSHYTGIMDGVFARRIGLGMRKNILVDIKTGDPDDAAAHLQTAAYEAAYALSGGLHQIHERWAIWLQPGLKVPYKVTNYSARPEAVLDLRKWLACLTTYNEQPARRQRVA